MTAGRLQIAVNARQAGKRSAAVDHLGRMIAEGWVAYPVGRRPKHLAPSESLVGVVAGTQDGAERSLIDDATAIAFGLLKLDPLTASTPRLR